MLNTKNVRYTLANSDSLPVCVCSVAYSDSALKTFKQIRRYYINDLWQPMIQSSSRAVSILLNVKLQAFKYKYLKVFIIKGERHKYEYNGISWNIFNVYY